MTFGAAAPAGGRDTHAHTAVDARASRRWRRNTTPVYGAGDPEELDHCVGGGGGRTAAGAH
jgi:hypothetical protein